MDVYRELAGPGPNDSRSGRVLRSASRASPWAGEWGSPAASSVSPATTSGSFTMVTADGVVRLVQRAAKTRTCSGPAVAAVARISASPHGSRSRLTRWSTATIFRAGWSVVGRGAGRRRLAGAGRRTHLTGALPAAPRGNGTPVGMHVGSSGQFHAVLFLAPGAPRAVLLAGRRDAGDASTSARCPTSTRCSSGRAAGRPCTAGSAMV